jgi:hypothetical protein
MAHDLILKSSKRNWARSVSSKTQLAGDGGGSGSFLLGTAFGIGACLLGPTVLDAAKARVHRVLSPVPMKPPQRRRVYVSGGPRQRIVVRPK